MTDLDVALTPAQWEHWDRHGWTLTEAPGEVWDSFLDGPTFVPVPATVPCPECNGHKVAVVTEFPRVIGPCPVCSGSGVVPRTVGIIRPERLCEASAHYWFASERRPCPSDLPAERVGTATVTAVPVVDVNGPWPQNEGAQFVTVGDGLVMLYTADRDADEGYDGEDLSGYGPTDPPLFATPPNPGTTVWRLDKENDR